MSFDVTLEVETLCRVIASAKRYQTVTEARLALQRIEMFKREFDAEDMKLNAPQALKAALKETGKP